MRHLKIYVISAKLISYLMARADLSTELLKSLMQFVTINADLPGRY